PGSPCTQYMELDPGEGLVSVGRPSKVPTVPVVGYPPARRMFAYRCLRMPRFNAAHFLRRPATQDWSNLAAPLFEPACLPAACLLASRLPPETENLCC